MEVLQCDVAQACLVPDARLFRGEDAGYLVSTASECGDREEMSPGGRNLNKQAARGKPWRKLEAAYGDGDGARLASAKSNALPSKSPPKRPEKGKSRKKVVAARRKYHRRPPKQRWSSGGWAAEEDGDSQCFPHRRPNASKFSKVGPNSCVFLPVPEDIFIEDMLSDVPHYCSNSQLKSGEFWCSVAADIPPYRSAGRTRRQKDTFKEKIQGTLK